MKAQLDKQFYSGLGEVLYRCQLDNGLEIALIPKPDYHEVLGMMAVRFGSLDEGICLNGPDKPSLSGLAHFLEHKMFELADGQDAMQQFASLGADVNAYTHYHHTAYYFSTTGSVLACIELLQTMLATTHFTEVSVERERGIIAQEIKMYEDEPDHRLYLSTLRQLYPESGLARDIAGDLSDIERISLRDLELGFKNFYQPGQMLLCLVGSFDLDEVVNYLDKTNAKQENHDTQMKVPASFHSGQVIKTGQLEMVVAEPKLSVGYRGQDNLTGLSTLSYRLALRLCVGLALGWTSSTYQDWYQKGKIDDSFSIDVEATDDYRFVIITLQTSEPISMSKRIQRRLKHFEKLPDMTESHLTLLKQEMLGDFLTSMNRLDFTAHQYVASWVAQEDLFDLPAILDQLTLEKVLEVGRDFIDRAQATEFFIFPK